MGGSRQSTVTNLLGLMSVFWEGVFPILTEFFGSYLAVFNYDLLMKPAGFCLSDGFSKRNDKATLLLSM